jgi:DNA-binding MarR family transcriptional regulator
MITGSKNDDMQNPGSTVDLDRFFPLIVSSIANKISRGGSRLYLRLFGVGIIEWRVLYVLADNPGSTAQQICNRIDLDKAAASRSIQVLERAGYIAGSVDPSDARKRSLALTSSGRILHDRILKVAMLRERRLLDGFSPAERELLLNLLKRMHDNAVRMDNYDYTGARDPAVRAEEAVMHAL